MLASKLRQRLQELSPELNSRLQGVHTKALQLIEYSQGGAHLTFTTHGASHISAVESNYDWLLSDSDLGDFNATEIFCLLSATFFHDALMIPARQGGESIARSTHAESAREFLMRNRDLVGLTLHEVDTIGDVIKGHGLDDLSSLRVDTVIGSQIIDSRKLSACLSLADLAHADSSRAPQIVLRHLQLDEESAFHWRRHLQISGITRKGDSILMSALSFSDEGERAVQEYRDSIQRQLTIIKPYFDTLLQPIRRVELNIKRLESPLDQTLRFQTNTPGILKVLIEGVYDREDVFVRELVQNSLDACLVRRLRLQRRNCEYTPHVLVTFFSEKKRLRAIRIDDNGIGMDLNDVRDTVLWIGSSIANQADIAELVQEAAGKSLIATFGIGLLSCFKVSDRILVRTAKERSTPLQFEMTSVSDAVKPEKSADSSVGTTIIVEIPNRALSLVPAETIGHYFRQIHQVDLRFLELEWSDVLANQDRDHLNKIARTEAKKIEIVQYPQDESAVQIPLQGDDYTGALWVLKSELKSLSDLEGTIEVLNEGVFVSSEETRDWLPKHFDFLSGFLNYAAHSLNLPAGRDRVIKDDVFRRKAAEVNKRAFRIIEQLIENSRGGGARRNEAAIILSHIFKRAQAEDRGGLLDAIGSFNVQTYKSQQLTTLNAIQRSGRSRVYLHYPKGRYVEELTEFDGKKLYHKQDDLTDLQAALMSQRGELVIAAFRQDESSDDGQIIEAPFIKSFLERANITTIDLSTTNILQGTIRSKPVPQLVRQRISTSVKFVDVNEMPNKISWRVGSEFWINTAHPTVARVYERLSGPQNGSRTADLAEILVDLLSYNLSDAYENLVKLIETT